MNNRPAEAQSEIVGNSRQTITDFFDIENENHNLREEIYEVQSAFTVQDHQYLQHAQEKFEAETDYENYRLRAQAEIKQLAEEARDKEHQLHKLQEQLKNADGMSHSHASGFSIGGDSDADMVKRKYQ